MIVYNKKINSVVETFIGKNWKYADDYGCCLVKNPAQQFLNLMGEEIEADPNEMQKLERKIKATKAPGQSQREEEESLRERQELLLQKSLLESFKRTYFESVSRHIENIFKARSNYLDSVIRDKELLKEILRVFRSDEVNKMFKSLNIEQIGKLSDMLILISAKVRINDLNSGGEVATSEDFRNELTDNIALKKECELAARYFRQLIQFLYIKGKSIRIDFNKVDKRKASSVQQRYVQGKLDDFEIYPPKSGDDLWRLNICMDESSKKLELVYNPEGKQINAKGVDGFLTKITV